MIQESNDRVVKLSIRMEVASLEWEVVIFPGGDYQVFGPMFGNTQFAELTRGKLGYGFSLPGIETALKKLIRCQLNKKK